MFTGIIEHLGQLEAIKPLVKGLRFNIRTELASKLELGESVAVNGVCLTVMAKKSNAIAVDVSPETLSLTTLDSWHCDELLHLELPVSLSKPLGGHFVTGHVDGVGAISHIQTFEDFTQFRVTELAHP